jgi:15-cis-phytoene synthase
MDALLAHSRRTIARGSKSFALASRLFDRRTRDRAVLLYAWCRHCDDVIDGQDLGATPEQPARALQEARLDSLRRRTAAAIAGEPQDDPAFASLQRVVQQCAIPGRYPEELLEGFAMDVRGERYHTFDDTLRYCYHVAGTVGAMMACVMGVTAPRTLLRGIHLGIGLQLTNIARDVMDDARLGRIYLPGEWLEEAGVPPLPERLPAHREAVVPVVHRLLDSATPYYASARAGIARLPFRSAWAVQTAARVYGEIGTVVRERGADAWSSRSSTSLRRKLALVPAAARDVRELRRGAAQTADVSGLWTPAELPDDSYASKR